MIIKATIPEYRLGDNLELRVVAKQIDSTLLEHFYGKKVVLRTISSSDHEMSKEQLIRQIESAGIDRYDTVRIGDRYENIDGKHIDFFGRTCTVKPGSPISKPLVDGFHIYGAEFHGRPSSKMDIWLIYDRESLKIVSHMYAGQTKFKRDGYVFKYPTNKPAALLGILVIE